MIRSRGKATPMLAWGQKLLFHGPCVERFKCISAALRRLLLRCSLRLLRARQAARTLWLARSLETKLPLGQRWQVLAQRCSRHIIAARPNRYPSLAHFSTSPWPFDHETPVNLWCLFYKNNGLFWRGVDGLSEALFHRTYFSISLALMRVCPNSLWFS